MYEQLPTALTPSRERVLQELQSAFTRMDLGIQEDRIQIPRHERRDSVLQNARNIARAELDRKRRRLGTLTRDQEVALENLLISTATKISALAEESLESFPHSNIAHALFRG